MGAVGDDGQEEAQPQSQHANDLQPAQDGDGCGCGLGSGGHGGGIGIGGEALAFGGAADAHSGGCVLFGKAQPAKANHEEDEGDQQDDESGDQLVEFRSQPGGGQNFAGEPDDEEAAEDGDVDEGYFLGGEHEGQTGREPPEMFVPGVSQVVPGGNEDDHGPGDDVDVVPDVAGVVGNEGEMRKRKLVVRAPIRPSQWRRK